MPIKYHPQQGTILICDFKGFVEPEMVKRRPVVVVSERLRNRAGLCTVVPLSTTPPKPIAAYHFKLRVMPPLPAPYDAEIAWVKGDMVNTVSFDRLFLPHNGKDALGQRIYVEHVVDKDDLLKIQQCLLHGIGLSALANYL